jgi:3-oxoacyl-[acyl-carrier protein] reductase
MDLRLVGKCALVMAGTRGLGLATANALASEGVKVTLVGRDENVGRGAATKVGNGASFIQGDLSDPDFRAELPSRAEETLEGSIDILVTNAGGPATGEFHQQPLDAWRKAYELNLFGHIDMAQRLVPAMAERGFGRVVNITSFVAKEPYPNMSLSNSVRVALHGAMASLSKEVAGRGVTVNNVMPG